MKIVGSTLQLVMNC